MKKQQDFQNVSLEMLESDQLPCSQNPDDYCSRVTRSLFEWVELFVFAIAAVWFLLSVLFRVAVVDGDSMQKTLNDRDTLLISNINYTPQRGDIVVFQIPSSPVETPIVKRCIAVGGDVVNIDFTTWRVTVNGSDTEESYVSRAADITMQQGDLSFPYTVPDGCIFVLGDNRNDSWDSRYTEVGAIDQRFVLGHVILRVFPLSSFGNVH